MKTNLIPAVLLLCVASGCGKSEPSPTPGSGASTPTARDTPSTPTDGKTVTAAGVSLTFPKDWQVVKMGKDEMEASLKAMEKEPRGAEIAQAARSLGASGMVKMFAVDPKSSKPGIMNNANLVVQEGVGNATLDEALEGSKKQIETMGMRTSVSKVTLPAGEFGRMESHMKAPNGSEYVAIGYMQIRRRKSQRAHLLLRAGSSQGVRRKGARDHEVLLRSVALCPAPETPARGFSSSMA